MHEQRNDGNDPKHGHHRHGPREAQFDQDGAGQRIYPIEAIALKLPAPPALALVQRIGNVPGDAEVDAIPGGALGVGAGVGGHGGAQVGVAGEAAHGVDHGVEVVGRGEEAGVRGGDDLARPARVARHHRQPARHRLQHHEPKRLRHAAVHEHVRARVRPRQPLALQEPREHHPVPERLERRPHLVLHAGVPVAAHDEQLEAEPAVLQRARDAGEEREAFLRRETPHAAEDDFAVRSELFPPGVVSARRVEEVCVDAAAEVDEFGFWDTCVHEIACHGRGWVEYVLDGGVGEEVALHDLQEPDRVAV